MPDCHWRCASNGLPICNPGWVHAEGAFESVAGSSGQTATINVHWDKVCSVADSRESLVTVELTTFFVRCPGELAQMNLDKETAEYLASSFASELRTQLASAVHVDMANLVVAVSQTGSGDDQGRAICRVDCKVFPTVAGRDQGFSQFDQQAASQAIVPRAVSLGYDVVSAPSETQPVGLWGMPIGEGWFIGTLCGVVALVLVVVAVAVYRQCGKTKTPSPLLATRQLNGEPVAQQPTVPAVAESKNLV